MTVGGGRAFLPSLPEQELAVPRGIAAWYHKTREATCLSWPGKQDAGALRSTDVQHMHPSFEDALFEYKAAAICKCHDEDDGAS